MSRTLSLILYNLCLPFGLVAMVPGALVKMRKRGGKWSDFSQRFGSYGTTTLVALEALPRDRGRFWVHAVSVGEVEIAKKFITPLLLAREDCGVVITTTTPTGCALARDFAARHAGRVVALYSPVDLPFVVRRAIDAIVPTQLVLVEAEVWPNLVSTMHSAGIPISLVNARLSPRSERRYHRLGFLVRPIFGLLDRVLVQDPEDVARWSALGIQPDRILRSGSVKFDPEGVSTSDSRLAAFRALLTNAGWIQDDPVLLAASTHAGEEVEIARVFQRLKMEMPALRLIIVPRHVERTPEVVEQLRGISLQPVLRTDLEKHAVVSECVIVNTTGELRAWQHLASVVVVGKSFLATGGQNPAEALMASKPVVFGPHMENFADIARTFLDQHGAVQVGSDGELADTLAALLDDPMRRATLGATAKGIVEANRGATARTLAVLGRLLPATPPRGAVVHHFPKVR